MANKLKYSTSPQTKSLKVRNFWVSPGDVAKGPTSVSGYYAGITPPAGGWTVYLNRASGGPAIYCPKNRLELLGLTNSLASAAYTTVEQCYAWFQTQSDKAIFTKDVESVITDGLVLHLDPGFIESYPKSGTTIYDLSGVGNHGSLANGASLSTTSYSPQSRAARVYDGSGVTYVEAGVAHEPSGSTEGFVLDGTDDIILFGASSAFMSQFHTYEAWIKSPGLGPNTVGGIFGINYGTIIYLTPSGEVFYYVWNTDPGHYEFLFSLYSAGVNLLDDQWHQIVCVRGPSEATIYIDGVFNNSTPSGPSWSGTTIWDGMAARIGDNPNNVNLRFTGQIGPVRIYNRDLSADEVYTNYKQYESSYGNGVNTASLLLNFDDRVVLYNEDKILASFPGDGSADFNFSGGDGGTRVNQQGYIEVTPVNLLRHSETYASWNLEGGTISGGWPDPIGGNTAYKYTSVGSNGLWSNGAFGPAYSGHPLPATITMSFWIKSFSGAAMQAYLSDGVATSHGWVSIIGEWQQITVTFNPNGPWGGFYLSTLSDPTKSFYIWHPQINIGSTAKPYQPTTDRLNYPRITYQNGRGALLQEPARTNLVPYSQNFSVSGWNQYNSATVTANTAISPDGTQNAHTLTVAVTGYSGLYRSFSGGTSIATVSGFFKKGTIDWVILINTSGSVGVAWFNLANGTIGTVVSGYTANIESFNDGWYRCSVTGPSQLVGIWQIAGATSDNNVTPAYAGTIYIYGAQVEVGEFPTSYIPTVQASVTRPLDEFWKNDSSALIATDWTFYMAGTNIGKNQNVSTNNIDAVNWSFDSGGGPYGPNSIHNYTNNIYHYDNTVGATFLGTIGTSTTKFTVTKTGNTFNVFSNGVLISSTSVSLNNNIWDSFRMYATVDAQGQQFSSNVSNLAILPMALSNAAAQALTTVRSATGGTITYDGAYAIHTFTGDDVFTPNFNGTLEVMVVAGGGGGGMDMGGGGGAGGLIYTTSYPVTANQSLAVIVGAGGAGAPAGGGSYRTDGAGPQPSSHQFTISATNGADSTFGSLSTRGGGYGASSYYGYLPNYGYGGTGGSGGGCSAYTHGGERYVDNNNIPGQGYPGGNSGNPASGGDDHYSGGGGGAGGRGTSGPNHVAPSGTAAHGGNGIIIPSLSPYWYAGGGGGSCYSGSKGGDGGKGGGGGAAAGGNGNTVGYGDTNGRNAAGNGALGNNAPGGNGGANTGGGGGGGSHYNWNNKGGEGGSGIVIVRYLI